MSEIARQKNIQTHLERSSATDVSMKLERIRHYLVLADEQHDFLHDYVEDNGTDISNRIGWLLDDLLNMLAEVQDILYPNDKAVTTARQGA